MTRSKHFNQQADRMAREARNTRRGYESRREVIAHLDPTNSDLRMSDGIRVGFIGDRPAATSLAIDDPHTMVTVEPTEHALHHRAYVCDPNNIARRRDPEVK